MTAGRHNLYIERGKRQLIGQPLRGALHIRRVLRLGADAGDGKEFSERRHALVAAGVDGFQDEVEHETDCRRGWRMLQPILKTDLGNNTLRPSSNAGTNGSMSLNAFDGACSTTMAQGSIAEFCSYGIPLSFVIRASNPSAAAKAKSRPLPMPFHFM